MNNKNVFKGTINMFKYINKCVKQAELKKYDVIYSSSIPSFTHLAAYRIKKRYPKIKWVASFSDPIFKSPYKKDPDTFKDYSILEKIGFYVYIFIYMNSSFEKMAMKHADEVIMISDAQKEFMCSNYDEDYRNKSHVVPLNYIKGWNIYKDLLSASHIKNDKLIAIHLGRLYGLRKIENFLIALSEIKEKVEGLIEFHQYGEIQPRYIKMINSLDLGKIFIIKKTVNYNSALTKLEEADVLLLFDTIMEGDNQPYLPSKIIEYMLMNKPILAISESNSPSYKMLKENNYVSNDVAEIKNYLLDIIFNYQEVDNRKKCIENEQIKQKMHEIL
jgi:hypothetical protein